MPVADSPQRDFGRSPRFIEKKQHYFSTAMSRNSNMQSFSIVPLEQRLMASSFQEYGRQELLSWRTSI
jgi:hypothetical protein